MADGERATAAENGGGVDRVREQRQGVVGDGGEVGVEGVDQGALLVVGLQGADFDQGLVALAGEWYVLGGWVSGGGGGGSAER